MNLYLEKARVSFAHGLFTPSAFEDGQQKKYGADFIITPETKVYTYDKSLADRRPITLKAAELEAATEGWKARAAEVLEDLEASKKAIRNGNRRKNKSGEIYAGYEGCWYITAKNATQPTLLDANKRPVTEESGIIYSGCYVNVFLSLYANTKPQTRGVFSGLAGVQFAGDGDSFGGGRKASPDMFEAAAVGADAEDFA